MRDECKPDNRWNAAVVIGVGMAGIAMTYVALAGAIWSLRSPLSLVVLIAGASYSTVTFLLLLMMFSQDDTEGAVHNAESRATDLRFGLGGALWVPLPYVLGALGIAWLYEQRSEPSLIAILLAAAITIIQLRRWLR